jgi:Family of unknown function (DUF6049)
MAGRAASALIATFAFAAIAPVTLLISGPAPAATAAGAANQPPVSVAFTGLSPQWASPGTTISVTGSVKDTSPAAERLTVQLLYSSVPIGSVSELQKSAAASATGQAGIPLPATWQSPVLRPGASASWSIRVPVNALGLTSFGVYPLAAQVYDARGNPLNNTLTYLPYVPAKGGPDGSSIPAAQKVSWVWPVIDQPLLDEPWQSACSGPQAAALAQSLGSGGRLGQLLDAAGATAGTAVVQAQKAQAGSSHGAQRLGTVTEPAQSLSQHDAVTWAVDPALLVNVSALAQCGASEPQWARAASAWLSRFKADTAGQPLFVTPYGDPNVTALIGAGYDGDVGNAYTYGRNLASQILGKDLTPPAPGSSTASTAGLAWSTGGPVSYTAAESLAGKDGISTLLAGTSAFPQQQASVLRTPDGGGAYMNVLLASDSLTSLLGSAGTGQGSAFATAQQFLAETALLAQQKPSAPIIVTPPQRWQPPAGLATQLLAETASAPWLSPASLTSLTGAANVPTVQLPASAPGLSPLEQSQFGALDADVARQVALRAQPDPNLYLAVSTVESSAYSGRFRETALGMIGTVAGRMASQEQGVRIVAENRITLGGTKGSVPVSIDNHLPFPVRVTLQLSYSQADGMKVTASPPGPRTVPSHTAQTIRLRITAAQTGSTTITMTLLNQANQPLASPSVRTTVQTTQVGLLGMTIFGAALGVFLLASAARAIRRGRPRTAPDEAHSAAPREDHQPGHSTEEAGPDTVVTGSRGAPPP